MTTQKSILSKIRKIGPCLPGNIDQYFSVCGKAGCRCTDKKNPHKHGPYYRLSFSLARKNSSMFVKQHDVENVKMMVDNYKKLRALTLDLGLATLESVKNYGVAETVKQGSSTSLGKRDGQNLWKEKCHKRTQELRAATVKIRDLKNSRDKWREECLTVRKKIKAAQQMHQGGKKNDADETGKKK